MANWRVSKGTNYYVLVRLHYLVYSPEKEEEQKHVQCVFALFL